MENIHKFNRFKYYSEKAAKVNAKATYKMPRNNGQSQNLMRAAKKIKNGANAAPRFVTE